MRGAFVNRLIELASADPRIFLITGDLGFGVLTPYWERFPRQFLNAGVAEQNMTGLATGLALEGRIVFTYSIANFPTLRCLEQIRNDACYHEANVKIVAVGGGFSYGALGISHHATEDLSILRALPGMTVVVPGDTWEAAEATSAIVQQPGTCYLRLDRSGTLAVTENNERFHLGEARTVRNGTDLTMIVSGGILDEALGAAKDLSLKGIECRVLSMHTLRPIDASAVLKACRETGGIMTIEEHTLMGGLGSAVSEVCMDHGVYPRKFIRLGLRGEFSSVVGSQKYLRHVYGLSKAHICERAQTLVRKNEMAAG
jgi:transketolase